MESEHSNHISDTLRPGTLVDIHLKEQILAGYDGVAYHANVTLAELNHVGVIFHTTGTEITFVPYQMVKAIHGTVPMNGKQA